MQIIDAHHHVWRLVNTPWLSGRPVPRIFGDYEGLRGDYLIEDYAADARPAGVTGSVHVQVNVEPGEEVAEVEWAAAAGAREGLIQAVVGFADLSGKDVSAILDRQQETGALRGIRQQLHWHANPAYRYAARPDLMADRRWRLGLAEVTRRGLLFELQVFPSQYPQALQLVDDFPDTTFVLLHAGMPEDRSDDWVAAWRTGIRQFARRPNVHVKLSGLGTFTRACTTAGWRPVIEQTIDTFGPGRCMFGSNFPIEGLWTSYATLLTVFRECLSCCSAGEQHQILYQNAAGVYRVRHEGTST
jgi:predicted TIM-barrel fold metal-dependent hydrolase